MWDCRGTQRCRSSASRARRKGQKRPVQVHLMISENTIEEYLLATLSAKHELAAAVLDPDLQGCASRRSISMTNSRSLGVTALS